MLLRIEVEAQACYCPAIGEKTAGVVFVADLLQRSGGTLVYFER
jgi:hypothetical protein